MWPSENISTDFEIGLTLAIGEVDSVPILYDILHTARTQGRKHRKLGGQKFLNKLKKHKIKG